MTCFIFSPECVTLNGLGVSDLADTVAHRCRRTRIKIFGMIIRFVFQLLQSLFPLLWGFCVMINKLPLFNFNSNVKQERTTC